MGLLGYVASQVWAVTPEMYEVILDVVERQNEDPQVVAARLGRPLENTRKAEVRDGVAIIPVTGVISRRMNMFTEVSGGTSVEVFARDFSAAIEDPAVSAVMVDVDSPGGDANGVGELAAMIRRGCSVKPVVGFTGGVAASGGYWIISACQCVVASPYAQLGSVGAIRSQTDRTVADERRGVTHHMVVSRQSPLKTADLTTDEGRAYHQERVDKVAAMFIEAVAENRGVSPETVESDFGQGGMLFGEAAVTAGMADAIGSFEQVLSELATGRHRRGLTPSAVPAALPKVPTMANDNASGAAADTQAGAPGIDMAEFERMKAALATMTAEQKTLKESNATERDARIKAEATAFVASNRVKFNPAEHVALEASYVQAATDDALHPLPSGSRVDNLKAQATARPAISSLQAMGGLPRDATLLGTGDEAKQDGFEDWEKRLQVGNSFDMKASTKSAEQLMRESGDPDLVRLAAKAKASA